MRKKRPARSHTMKKRLGMYPEQFYLLRKGDIVRMVRSKAPRKILRISKNHFGDTTFIELDKLRPSWTSHWTTLYDANCARQFIPLKVKDRRIWQLTYEVVLAQRVRHYKHYRDMEIRRLTKRLDRLRVK